MAILRIRDANGNVQEILAIKGNDYVLTEADKQEIADMIGGTSDGDGELSGDNESTKNINLQENPDIINTLLQNFENNSETAPSWSSVNGTMDEWATKGTSNGDDTNTVELDTSGKIVAGAFGANSVALNGKGQAKGGKSLVAGSKSVALGNNAFATGNGTFAGGQHSFTGGNGTSAIGNSSFATGSNTVAKGKNSFAIGDNAKATGGNSFSGGQFTEASGEKSLATGDSTKATNTMAVAEGYQTESSGYASHSLGGRTKAKAAYTLSGGFETIAGSDYQTAIGRANTEDTNANYLFIIGNGKINDDYSVKERSNALTVDWNGNTKIAGNLTFRVNGKEYTMADILDRLSKLEGQSGGL